MPNAEAPNKVTHYHSLSRLSISKCLLFHIKVCSGHPEDICKKLKTDLSGDTEQNLNIWNILHVYLTVWNDNSYW